MAIFALTKEINIQGGTLTSQSGARGDFLLSLLPVASRVNINGELDAVWTGLTDEYEQDRVLIMMVAHFGSGIWTPCLSTGPDKDGSSSSLMKRKYLTMYLLTKFIEKEKKKKNLTRDCQRRVKTSNSPSGGSDMGGLRQYMWYPLSQSSQNRSWSWRKHIRRSRL